jgi:N utilization substance protein A
MQALDVDDVLAHLLVTEGFATVEDVAFVPLEDLLSIEGFDEDLSKELQSRAQAYLAAEAERQTVRRRELGVGDTVAAIKGLTPAMLVTLGENGIKTLDDLADLSSDELINSHDGLLRGHKLSEADANAIVMAARAHWFENEPPPVGAAVSPAVAGTAAEAAPPGG